jgi:hypothetical protein
VEKSPGLRNVAAESFARRVSPKKKRQELPALEAMQNRQGKAECCQIRNDLMRFVQAIGSVVGVAQKATA